MQLPDNCVPKEILAVLYGAMQGVGVSCIHTRNGRWVCLGNYGGIIMDVTVFVILGFMYLCKPLYSRFVKRFGEMD